MIRATRRALLGGLLATPPAASAESFAWRYEPRAERVAESGHSDGDLALLDEATGALLAGDLAFHDRAPATPDAELTAWGKSLDQLAAIPHRLLVPGHGPLDRDGSAIAQTRDRLDWLDRALRQAVANGLDMTEAGALTIPPRFAALKAARYELERSVAHLYPRFKAQLLPRIDAATGR